MLCNVMLSENSFVLHNQHKCQCLKLLTRRKKLIFFDDFEFDNNEAENLGEKNYTHIRLPYISIISLTS